MRNEYKLSVGKTERKEPPEKPGVDWRIILEWILEIYWEGLDRIHLAQDRDQ
jgi:hypothetical protein